MLKRKAISSICIMHMKMPLNKRVYINSVINSVMVIKIYVYVWIRCWQHMPLLMTILCCTGRSKSIKNQTLYSFQKLWPRHPRLKQMWFKDKYKMLKISLTIWSAQTGLLYPQNLHNTDFELGKMIACGMLKVVTVSSLLTKSRFPWIDSSIVKEARGNHFTTCYKCMMHSNVVVGGSGWLDKEQGAKGRCGCELQKQVSNQSRDVRYLPLFSLEGF